MVKFRIIQTENPCTYREQIIKFWDQYLPGTPHGRLEWMQNGNPAGPTCWLLAIKEDTKELIGTISIMPRRFFFYGKFLRAGIVGDFMVHEKHRVFGPSLNLIKTVVENFSDFGFDFLYTIPNGKVLGLLKYNGFEYVDKLYRYVKPLKVKDYLKKYFPYYEKKVLNRILEILLKFLSLDMYMPIKGIFNETLEMGVLFDVFWEKIKKRMYNGFSEERSSENLIWRYLKNPHYQFRFLTYREREDCGLSGYAIYCIHDGIMEIFDIIGSKKKDICFMLKKIIEIARVRHCKSIYFNACKTDSRIRIFKAYGFINTRDGFQIFQFGSPINAIKHWNFVSGYRNI